MEGKYILEMQDITKKFPGVLALDKVRLKVRKGTVHALMGENGSYRTTVKAYLCQLLRKTFF